MIAFDHYLIRLIEEKDLDAYFDLIERNRDRLAAFFTGTVSRTKTFEDTKIFLEEIVEKSKNKIYLPYLLIDTNENNIIGFFDIKNIDWNLPKAELGSYTDENQTGKGLTTLAFRHFVNHCFGYYGFEKLFLRTHESNVAARKVAEKCGFIIEGKIRKDYKTTAGELVDLIYYGKIKEDH